eukprot:SAG11_NODE_1423_length_4950_cov_6.926201_4_plen_82_part_00
MVFFRVSKFEIVETYFGNTLNLYYQRCCLAHVQQLLHDQLQHVVARIGRRQQPCPRRGHGCRRGLMLPFSAFFAHYWTTAW